STTQSATITFTAYNTAGTKLGSQVINLGPLAHSAANVGPLLGLQSFTGFVKITSTIPIISLSLNFEAAPVFSSLPPGDLPGSTMLVAPYVRRRNVVPVPMDADCRTRVRTESMRTRNPEQTR